MGGNTSVLINANSYFVVDIGGGGTSIYIGCISNRKVKMVEIAKALTKGLDGANNLLKNLKSGKPIKEYIKVMKYILSCEKACDHKKINICITGKTRTMKSGEINPDGEKLQEVLRDGFEGIINSSNINVISNKQESDYEWKACDYQFNNQLLGLSSSHYELLGYMSLGSTTLQVNLKGTQILEMGMEYKDKSKQIFNGRNDWTLIKSTQAHWKWRQSYDFMNELPLPTQGKYVVVLFGGFRYALPEIELEDGTKLKDGKGGDAIILKDKILQLSDKKLTGKNAAGLGLLLEFLDSIPKKLEEHVYIALRSFATDVGMKSKLTYAYGKFIGLLNIKGGKTKKI